MDKLLSFILSFLGISGSQSSDIANDTSIDNPLLPCPNSPNCVRISKQIQRPLDTVFQASTKVLESMNPHKVTVLPNEYRIETVFRVFFFKDDFILQLSKANSTITNIYIRSASRVGKSDLGVNKKRVLRFLDKLYNNL